MNNRYDIGIVGGGILGLATTLSLIETAPSVRIVVLEKEPRVGLHQTGHNSGVVHSGVYYRPGSLKARLCVEGVQLLRAFCEEEGLDYREYGKVLVAIDEGEVPALEEIQRRGMANGVPGLRRLDASRIREIEPYAAGVDGLHVPVTASVDFAAVAEAMARRAREHGADVRTSAAVAAIATGSEVRLSTSGGDVTARLLVNCAGLHSDRVARMAGIEPPVRIVPFRGEYYRLRPDRSHLVNGMLYPVPDPRFPFLGVHFTRTVTGEVEAGPNAVLALAREGYRWRDVSFSDLGESLRFPGFWKVARRYWKTGVEETVRSVSTRAFIAGMQRLVPSIERSDVRRAGAGVRAQAVDRDGHLVDDFVIEESAHAVHVLNAPSPAATASLAIGRHVAALVGKWLE